MRNSPYSIEPSERVKRALRIAIKKGLFDRTEVTSRLINNYLRSKGVVPIWVVEAACNLNANDPKVPIQYQNVWFCLNQSKLIRETPTKRMIVKLSFYSVYVEPKQKITNLIEKAILKVGTKTELAKLCGVKHRQLVYQWTLGKIRPQLMALMKICQLLNKDLWTVLDGCKLYGHSCPEEESITFYNYDTLDIVDILLWIKFEGHLALSQPHVETNQHRDAKVVLNKLASKLINFYKINPKSVWIYDNSIKQGTVKDWRGYKLTIASAPLRQVLCLRYGIPLGYKCSFISIKQEIDSCNKREDLCKLFAVALDTEGSFTHKREKNYLRPIISFTTTSSKLLKEMSYLSNKLSYKSYKVVKKDKKVFDLRVAETKSVVKCFNDVLEYIIHPIKKEKIYNHLKNIKLRYGVTYGLQGIEP